MLNPFSDSWSITEFIPGYSGISNCLYKLAGPKSKLVWSSDHQFAFEILKHCLVTVPFLAFPKSVGLFILDTEATDFAIGAELDQVQNGDECAFACSSYILSPA